MKTITVTLPLPPRGLNPNAHVINYRQRARLIKKQRTEAGELAFAASGGKRLGWEKAAAQATFYFGTKRRRDTDNFNSSLKGAYDGLADAGVIVNDSGLVHLPPRFDFDADRPRVEIIVTPIATVEQPTLRATQATVTRRRCPKCDKPMVRGTMPLKITCLECPGRVYEESQAAQYPWDN